MQVTTQLLPIICAYRNTANDHDGQVKQRSSHLILKTRRIQNIPMFSDLTSARPLTCPPSFATSIFVKCKLFMIPNVDITPSHQVAWLKFVCRCRRIVSCSWKIALLGQIMIRKTEDGNTQGKGADLSVAWIA